MPQYFCFCFAGDASIEGLNCPLHVPLYRHAQLELALLACTVGILAMGSQFSAVVLLLLFVICDGSDHLSWKTILVNSYTCVKQSCSIGGTCCDLKEALTIAEDAVSIIVQTDSYLSTPVEVCNKRGLHIHGSPGHDAVQVECTANLQVRAGLGFYNVTDLYIDNLCLIGCGAVFNFSTCFVGFNSETTPPAALHVHQSKIINLSSITIARSFGRGMVIEKSTGNITLRKIVLFRNTPKNDAWTGGGIAIVLNEKAAVVHITQCVFASNQAIVHSPLDNGLYSKSIDRGHGG